MAQQTFTVGIAPRVIIAQVHGDLSVRVWNQQIIGIETDGRISGLQQEGDALLINECDSDIELQVPADTSIRATNIMGDLAIEGVRMVMLENASGDVSLKNISGDAGLENIAEAVTITNLGGDLDVTNTPVLRVHHSVGGDVSLEDVALVEIETVGSDLSVEGSESVVVSTVGGDLDANNVIAVLRCGVVGGDCRASGSACTEVTIGNIGGDLQVDSAASVQLGNVGSDCALRDIQGDVQIGYVGSDISLRGVGGNLRVGSIGSDAQLNGLQGSIEVGGIGGDLELQTAFPIDSRTRLNVGGDAMIKLPDNANLTIRANVGGDVSGKSIITSGGGNLVNLVYGDGSAYLELNVGGDMALRSGDSPRSSSSSSGSWGDFGREMSNLGREMGKMGQELSREIASAFNAANWTRGSRVADNMARKAEERARHAQRHAEERAHHMHERAPRVNIRLNDREWRLDPERLEHIKEQARRAAAEGVSGALEAVERAVGNLHIPVPPMPSAPPSPPVPPSSSGPIPPVPPVPPAPNWPMPGPQGGASQSEQAVQATGAENAAAKPPTASALDIEQEREAILRMIAEGRVTPEEGDMLLEALGS